MIRYQTVWLKISKSKFLVQSNSIELTKQTATQLNIDFDQVMPSLISPRNPVFKVWTLGEIAELLKEKR